MRGAHEFVLWRETQKTGKGDKEFQPRLPGDSRVTHARRYKPSGWRGRKRTNGDERERSIAELPRS